MAHTNMSTQEMRTANNSNQEEIDRLGTELYKLLHDKIEGYDEKVFVKDHINFKVNEYMRLGKILPEQEFLQQSHDTIYSYIHDVRDPNFNGSGKSLAFIALRQDGYAKVPVNFILPLW